MYPEFNKVDAFLKEALDLQKTEKTMFDLVPSARPIILTYHKGTQRSYVFLVHDKDYAHYQRIVSIVVNQWAPIFEPESLEK